METMMTAKFQLLIAGLATLCFGAVLALPAFAADDAHHPLRTNQAQADAVYPEAPHLAPKLRPDPQHTQIAEDVTGGCSAKRGSSSTVKPHSPQSE
jgi:hypothetical protein